jgi:hypothetical protein
MAALDVTPGMPASGWSRIRPSVARPVYSSAIMGSWTRFATGLALVAGIAGIAPAGADAGVWTVSPVPWPPQDCGLASADSVPGHATVWAVGSCPGPQLVSYRRRANRPWEVFLVPTSGEGSLEDVAAVNGRDVWAVGVTTGGAFPGSEGIIERWNGTAWVQIPSPDPGLGTAHQTMLAGVAVASPTSVWAVGWHTGRRNRRRTLVEHWNGSAWTMVPTPNANALDNVLDAVVTVPKTGSVWAFGVHATRTGGSRQLILHRGRYGWAVARRQPFVPASRLDGGAVVPGPSGGVWAVGEAQGDFLTERHSASGWRVVPSPGRSGFNELSSAAAIPGTSHLWAVGNLSTERVVIMRWTGDSWRITPSPVLGGCPGLGHVAAISRVDAWAVGTTSGCGSSVAPLAEHYHETGHRLSAAARA